MISEAEREKEKNALRSEGKLLISKLGKELKKPLVNLVKTDGGLKNGGDLMKIVEKK